MILAFRPSNLIGIVATSRSTFHIDKITGDFSAKFSPASAPALTLRDRRGAPAHRSVMAITSANAVLRPAQLHFVVRLTLGDQIHIERMFSSFMSVEMKAGHRMRHLGHLQQDLLHSLENRGWLLRGNGDYLNDDSRLTALCARPAARGFAADASNDTQCAARAAAIKNKGVLASGFSCLYLDACRITNGLVFLSAV